MTTPESPPLMDRMRLGERPDAPLIRDLIRHEQTGLLIDPKRGIVYGVAGTPVGAVCADGYVRLGGNRKGRLYAHRLVWEAVNGPIPAGLEIDHRNGKKADNRACNLDLVTRAENIRRAVAMGLAPVGEDRPYAKLTAAIVREIRLTAGKVSNAEWAKKLGVNRTTIRQARDGTTWKHVPCRGRSRPPATRPRRRWPRG